MIKWLIKIIWGSNCKHEWDFIHKNEYGWCTKFLFKCKKCGDFKNKRV